MNLHSLAQQLVPLPIVLPLLVASGLAMLRRQLSRGAAQGIAIGGAVVHLAVSLLLLHHSMSRTIIYWFGNWFPRGTLVPGIGFLVDPAAAALCAMAGLLVTLGLIFEWGAEDDGFHHFQPLMMIFLAAMSGFALTCDLFNLFVWFELMSIAAFALCGLNTLEPAPLQGSFNFAVTNTIAAFLELTGIAMLYAVTGALNMAQIGLAISAQAGGPRHDSLVLFAFTLLACGFFVKSAIVPFHLWLPDAHSVAPTSVCVLFSGLMVELGLYAFARLHAVIFQNSLNPQGLRIVLLLFATATVCLGGLMCYAEHHLKRILAFSTICHSGMMLGLLAAGGRAGMAAFLIYLLAHAVVKASLFFCAGIVLQRLRSVSEQLLWQRRRVLRWTGLLWTLGGLGLSGLPPFGTWIGSALAESTDVPALHWLFFIGETLTTAAVLRVGMHIFAGWGSAPLTDPAAYVDELPETSSEHRKVQTFRFLMPVLCLIIAVALAAPSVARWANLAADRLIDQAGYWHVVATGSSIVHHIALPMDWYGAAVHSLIALAAAISLAVTSVFRHRLPKRYRLGAILEGRLPILRNLQSGHPGDYVLWLTVGTATPAFFDLVFLR